MEPYQYTICVSGDVGTYKAVLSQKLELDLNGSGLSCLVKMDDNTIMNAFKVFVTTSKSEFHAEHHRSVLNQYDLIVDVDKITIEDATEFIVEQFAKWIS